MKLFTAIFCSIACLTAHAQDTAIIAQARHHVYEHKSIIATLSLGFIDEYRRNYSLPSAFEKNNAQGFLPVFGRIEYGLGKQISIAAIFGYDGFTYNFKQVYAGYNEPIKRDRTDDMHIFSAGIAVYYHLTKYIHVNNVDPFVGIGLSLDNIHYDAYPQGDSQVVKTDHIATPYIKAGARWYISSKFSAYGDIGYNKECIFSLGFSTRFFPKQPKVNSR